MPPANSAVWFEIPATDMARARSFYEAVLKTELKDTEDADDGRPARKAPPSPLEREELCAICDGVIDIASCVESLEILSAPDGWGAPARVSTALEYNCTGRRLFSGDFTGDGVDDLAFNAQLDSVVTGIVPGPLPLTEAAIPGDLSIFFGGYSGAILADIDGDGAAEALMAGYGEDGYQDASLWAWRLENVHAHRDTPRGCPVPRDPIRAAEDDVGGQLIGDVNGDGRIDIFAPGADVVITEVCDLAP